MKKILLTIGFILCSLFPSFSEGVGEIFVNNLVNQAISMSVKDPMFQGILWHSDKEFVRYKTGAKNAPEDYNCLIERDVFLFGCIADKCYMFGDEYFFSSLPGLLAVTFVFKEEISLNRILTILDNKYIKVDLSSNITEEYEYTFASYDNNGKAIMFITVLEEDGIVKVIYQSPIFGLVREMLSSFSGID